MKMTLAPLGEKSVGALGFSPNLRLPYWAIFLCCYIDEPIRYVLMQIHLYNGRWIKPVTDLGLAALPEFRETHQRGR